MDSYWLASLLPLWLQSTSFCKQSAGVLHATIDGSEAPLVFRAWILTKPLQLFGPSWGTVLSGYPVCTEFLANSVVPIIAVKFVVPNNRYIIIYSNPCIIDYIHFSVSCWNLIFLLYLPKLDFLLCNLPPWNTYSCSPTGSILVKLYHCVRWKFPHWEHLVKTYLR